MNEFDDGSPEQLLVAAGAVLRRGKSGNVLLADLSGVANPADEITESFVAAIAKWTKLCELSLVGWPVDSDLLGLVVASCPALKSIDLERTAVDDRVFDHLKTLDQLKVVVLTGASVTDEGLASARKRMIRTRLVRLDG